MIPSTAEQVAEFKKVYQRGLVIDSQHVALLDVASISVSKGIGD